MTNVLMSYYIEVVNVMMTFCTVPLIYVLGVEPLPLPLAQFAYIAVHSCGSLIVALGSAVYCCQIVYVTNFEVLFALDPEEVGRRTFALLALLICLPNAVEAAQASAYVDAFKHARPAGLAIWRGSAEIAELMALAERFLGTERTRRAFEGFAGTRGVATPE